MKKLESFIRNIPDFPVKGIQFKDITTLLKNGELFAQAVDQLYVPFREKEINKIVGIEARGFIFASALAYKLNLGLIVDDLLATGGTASAAARLVERLGGEVVGLSFLIELTELKARSMFKNYQLFSLLQFPF